MDNRVPDEAIEELPRQETLARLYELRDRIDQAIATNGVVNVRSAAERHRVEHGHRLAFGCCRVTDDVAVPVDHGAGGIGNSRKVL